jgi:hypothetical protein
MKYFDLDQEELQSYRRQANTLMMLLGSHPTPSWEVPVPELCTERLASAGRFELASGDLSQYQDDRYREQD